MERSLLLYSIDDRTRALTQKLATEYGERFVEEYLKPSLQSSVRHSGREVSELTENLLDPYTGLSVFFDHYAFSRRGKERETLAKTTCEALSRLAKGKPFTDALGLSDGEVFWQEFLAISDEDKRKPQEQINRGVIQGMLELAQEIYRLDGVGSICAWVKAAVENTGRIDAVFERIVDIRGMGPKTTSLFLRDMVFLYGLEDQIDNVDRLLLQPVDRWLRLSASYLVPDLEEDQCADWILAGKVAKLARHAGVSGIMFNMGSTFFGMKEVKNPEFFEACIERL